MRFIKLRFHVDVVGREWIRIIDELHVVKIFNSLKLISWFLPESGWLKGNKDGASKENPVPSSIAFCIRDKHGNQVVAQGIGIKKTTSLEAETLAIRECLKCCSSNSIK